MGEAAKLFTRSAMMGLDSSVRKEEFAEPSADEIENLPYAEAVEYLKKRDVIKKVDYNKLSDKMRFRAFTASRINDGKLLEKLNAEMIANVHDGKGLKDFLSLTKTDILDKIGMGPNQGWYWETVYRTNVQTAYNAGRAMGFEEDKPLALELIVIDDSRTSDICRQYAGKRFILPYDHPFWQTHWPPFHFNCRTTIRAIYDRSELPANWSNPKDIEDAKNGFGTNPLASDDWWSELASQTRQAKYFGVQGEIEAAKVAFGLNSESGENLAPTSNKVLSAEEQKKVDEIKQKFIDNNFFIPATNKNLSLDGMDAESAQSVFTSFERLFNKFPKMKGVLAAIKTADLQSNAFASTIIQNGQKQILFNKLFYNDYKSLIEKYEICVAENFHPIGTSANSNVYHEFAHCLDDLLTVNMSNAKRKKYGTFSNYALSKTLKLTNFPADSIIKNVSEYASRDSREWFAEAFAEGFESTSPREMSKVLMKLLTEFM